MIRFGCVALLLAGVMGSAAAGGRRVAVGSIAGVIKTTERAGPALRLTIDQSVCGGSLPDEGVTVDAAGHLANAVVTVTGMKGLAPAEAGISNTGCRFTPRVSLLRPSGTVKMTSVDPVLHTMHAAGDDGRALFNISLPVPNVPVWRPIDRPGPVQFSCSTHPWMRGYLFVTGETSVITGTDGAYRIDNVPAGVVEVRLWHETLRGTPIKVTVKDGATVTADFVVAK